MEPSIEMSSIKDDDDDERRILKLMKSQHNNGAKSFKVNIQISATENITLKTECNKDTVILDLKKIIMIELNKDNIDNIELQYQGDNMDNNSILSDYNITDSRHLIKLLYKVQNSNIIMNGIKKFASNKDVNSLNGNNNNTGGTVYGNVMITYNLPDNTTHTYGHPINSSVGDLKRYIRGTFRIPLRKEIQLFSMNVELQDYRTIGYHGINGDPFIVVKYKFRGFIPCCWSDARREKLKRIALFMFVICSITFDITMMAVENKGFTHKAKCTNPVTGKYYGYPISIYGFIMFFSLFKLIYVAVPVLLLIMCGQMDYGDISSLKIRTYFVFLWCFCSAGFALGLYTFNGGSIPTVCQGSKSGKLMAAWIGVHQLCGPVFMVILSYYMCCGSKEILKEYGLSLVISLFILAYLSLDWLPIVARSGQWSVNECINVDLIHGVRYEGRPIDIKAFLFIGWLGKIVFNVGMIGVKIINDEDIRSVLYSVCFWFVFIFGLFGVLTAYAFGGGISNDCMGSSLGILFQIWSAFHIIIAIIMVIVVIKNVCEYIKSVFVGLFIFGKLMIPILTLLGHYSFTNIQCYSTGSPISVSQYLKTMGWSDVAFMIALLLGIMGQACESEIITGFIVAFLYGIYSIIMGSIGLNTLAEKRITASCLTTYMGVMFKLNSYYHVIFSSLIIIGCLVYFYGKGGMKSILPIIAGLLCIGLLINAIFAVIASNKYDDISISIFCAKDISFDGMSISDASIEYMGKPTNIKSFLSVGGWCEIAIFIGLVIGGCSQSESLMGGALCLTVFIFIWSWIGIGTYHGPSLTSECRSTKMASQVAIYSYTNIFIYMFGCCLAMYFRKKF